MHEYAVHRVDQSCEALIGKLQDGIEDPESLSSIELEQLEALLKLNVIYVEPTKHKATCDLFDLLGCSHDYVNEQLAHARIAVRDLHPDPSYAQEFSKLLSGYVTVTDKSPTLNLYIVDTINKLDEVEYPALIIKMGSYRPSIGPLLTTRLSLAEMKAVVLKGKIYFENESFEVVLGDYLEKLQVHLIFHELLSFIIRVGSHQIASSLVDWDLVSMGRYVWPI